MMTPTTWTPEDAARIVHRHTCTAPLPYVTRGSQGDVLLKCGTCGRFDPLPTPDATLSAPDAPPAPTSTPLPVVAVSVPQAIVGRYVCGLHTGVPVSWRGTGCRICADEHRARHSAKLEVRAARRDARMTRT